MKTLKFECTFLSDIILSGQTATEGNQDTLDYIPGSNFLGIVARNYNQLKPDQAYTVFHSGKIRFLDGHRIEQGQNSYKCPLSWFTAKGDAITSDRYVHHALTLEHHKNLMQKGLQLKQVRSGWLEKKADAPDSALVLTTTTNFSIKSAYDPDKRRSEEGKMFGYTSLEPNTRWRFDVQCDDEQHIDWLRKQLEGIRSIGRSRSAQYGRVKIKFLAISEQKSEEVSPVIIGDHKYIFLYAATRLVFSNEWGCPTFQPSPQQLGLEGWQTDLQKSQLTTGYFAPWNGKVQKRLADRAFIDKGSVIAMRAVTDSAALPQKMLVAGDYQNEGFGQILVNPWFLNFDQDGKSTCTLEVHKDGNKESFLSVMEKGDNDDAIYSWVQQTIERKQEEQDIYQAVQAFINGNKRKFTNITASQWGQVRAIAACEKSVESLLKRLFDRVAKTEKTKSHDLAQAGFLCHGKNKKLWNSGRAVLQKELRKQKRYGTTYAEKLAAQMQKVAQKNRERHND